MHATRRSGREGVCAQEADGEGRDGSTDRSVGGCGGTGRQGGCDGRLGA